MLLYLGKMLRGWDLSKAWWDREYCPLTTGASERRKRGIYVSIFLGERTLHHHEFWNSSICSSSENGCIKFMKFLLCFWFKKCSPCFSKIYTTPANIYFVFLYSFRHVWRDDFSFKDLRKTQECLRPWHMETCGNYLWICRSQETMFCLHMRFCICRKLIPTWGWGRIPRPQDWRCYWSGSCLLMFTAPPKT